LRCRAIIDFTEVCPKALVPSWSIEKIRLSIVRVRCGDAATTRRLRRDSREIHVDKRIGCIISR
jgi:hypothetical protein